MTLFFHSNEIIVLSLLFLNTTHIPAITIMSRLQCFWTGESLFHQKPSKFTQMQITIDSNRIVIHGVLAAGAVAAAAAVKKVVMRICMQICNSGWKVIANGNANKRQSQYVSHKRNETAMIVLSILFYLYCAAATTTAFLAFHCLV